jgi:hypothetical protein
MFLKERLKEMWTWMIQDRSSSTYHERNHLEVGDIASNKADRKTICRANEAA